MKVDGKIPNLALMRIAAHHRERGDDVMLSRGARVMGLARCRVCFRNLRPHSPACRAKGGAENNPQPCAIFLDNVLTSITMRI